MGKNTQTKNKVIIKVYVKSPSFFENIKKYIFGISKKSL